MKQKYFLISIAIVFFEIHGSEHIEESSKQCFITINFLQKWFKISYDKKTAIFDIKKKLYETETIAIEKQKLFAVLPTPNYYSDVIANFQPTKSENLLNDVTIEELLKKYGNNVFLELYETTHYNSI